MTENKKALKDESQQSEYIITHNTGKESLILYTNQKEVIDNLSDEDAGKLFKNVLAMVRRIE